MKRHTLFIIACLIVVVDQITKYWAFQWLSPYHPIELLPSLQLTLAFNTGAAFSFLSGAGAAHRWFLGTFSLLMSSLIIFWIWRTAPSEKCQQMGLSLILGGAVGNMVDRFFYGYVIDFIDVYYKNYHWPIFNVADIAISIGAGLLLLSLFLKR